MEKRNKIIFWIATGLLSAMMVMSVGMYIFNHDEVAATFVKLGHPAYVVYPLALMKLLGVVAIITRKSAVLKEWAYAGFTFNFILAFSAHLAAQDGEQFGALVALVLLAVSYIFGNMAFSNKKKETVHA
ncbi:MAG: DoxX family protein [Bacteroidota bacterium]